MVLGLRGPVGGPCKSEDTTGWGLIIWSFVGIKLLVLHIKVKKNRKNVAEKIVAGQLQ